MLRTLAVRLTAGRVQAKRCLAHRPRRSMSMLASGPLKQQQEKDFHELNDFFPTLVEELKQQSKFCNLPQETLWQEKILNFSVPGGKLVRAMATYNGIKVLAGPDQLNAEFLHKAKALAWSIELIQAGVNLGDDIADNSVTRRGKPAWHVMVGPGAVFDVLLVEHTCYRLLQHYLSGDSYTHVIQLYLDTMFLCCFGQNQDIHSSAFNNKPQFDDFSHELYQVLYDFKTGEYTCYLPIATAMCAQGLTDPTAHKRAREISSVLGALHQAQDDYLALYGKTQDKDSTDIRNGKCTWMIAEAKLRANDKQLRTLKENYGYDDAAKVSKVQEIFSELKMEQVFLEYKKKTIATVEQIIERYSKELPPMLYTYVLESIKNRMIL